MISISRQVEELEDENEDMEQKIGELEEKIDKLEKKIDEQLCIKCQKLIDLTK